MKRALIVGLSALLAVGSCATVAVIHDQRLGLQPNELRNVIPPGSNEADAFALLQALAAHPPDDSKVYSYPSKTVQQEDCFSAPMLVS